MRPFRLASLSAAAALLALLFHGSAHVASALERISARAPDEPGDEWNAGDTCVVRYYNICTGWVWVWSGWSTGTHLATAFQGCCPQAVLTLTSHLTFSGIGMGWGYTGTIGVYAVDADDCPTGPPLAEQPWRPPVRSGWHNDVWNVSVPRDFAVQVTWRSSLPDQTGLASDRPAAGATGPQACGLCYPTTRTVRSFYYGDVNSPYCPGHTFHDGVCDVEFLTSATLACPVHVEDESWGKIKSLYR